MKDQNKTQISKKIDSFKSFSSKKINEGKKTTKKVEIKNDKLYVNGIGVNDIGREYVILRDDKGEMRMPCPGCLEPAGIGNHQLQGYKYTKIFRQFKKLIEDGKTLIQADRILSNPELDNNYDLMIAKGTWKEIKVYLDI